MIVKVKGRGEFEVPKAFLQSFEQYGSGWQTVLLSHLFDVDVQRSGEDPDVSVRDTPHGALHVTVSQPRWESLDSEVTFTLTHFEHSGEEDEPDRTQDVLIKTPKTEFTLPRVLTRVKLGKDPESWPRRFLVDLLGLSERMCP
jgi:hypothetical protein